MHPDPWRDLRPTVTRMFLINCWLVQLAKRPNQLSRSAKGKAREGDGTQAREMAWRSRRQHGDAVATT